MTGHDPDVLIEARLASNPAICAGQVCIKTISPRFWRTAPSSPRTPPARSGTIPTMPTTTGYEFGDVVLSIAPSAPSSNRSRRQ